MAHKRRIRYRHPLYPGLIRMGTVQHEGKDGCVVENDETRLEERVRHDDVVGEVPGGAEDEDAEGGDDAGAEKSWGAPLLLKATKGGRSGSPTRTRAAAASVALKMGKVLPSKASQKGLGKLGMSPKQPVTTTEENLPQWAVPRRLPYDTGHEVEYQRPDMAVSEVGRIEATGRHGATVSTPNGGRRPVRWEHIAGPATAHVAPEEGGDALLTLKKMGVPVDEADAMMIPGAREDRPNATLLERVKALASDGAPIDAKRAPEMNASAVRRAIERFTGPLPREDPEQPPKPKKGAKPAPLTAWREDAEEE